MWPAPPELTSALADQYTLHSVLGVGGTSTVYSATDRKHDRDVAVKVLRPDLAASLTQQRFARETAIAAKLQHPHILPLIDSGAAANTYYYVMPLVVGITLRQRLAEPQALEIGEIARILADLADALVYAHGQGVVHRDLKPSNVLLAGRHALLMDFGVAKGHATPAEEQAPLTVGVALGTPTYMAPEQAMALPDVDHRADLYALGVLGYELLVGRPPFSSRAPREVLAAHVSQPPEPLNALRPDVPDALNEIVMRCLEKSPEARWPDAAAIVERLDAIATPSEWTTPLAGAPAVRTKPVWQRGWVTAPAAAVILVAGALALPRSRIETGLGYRMEQITHVGNAIESAVSPDGDWLAYVTEENRDRRLYVRDLNATTALELDRGANISRLMWSPDGSEIAYAMGLGRATAVRAIPRLGGTGRILGVGQGSASPDLNRIAFIPTFDAVGRIIGIAGADTTYLRKPAWVRSTAHLAWSPDSKKIAVAAADHDLSDYAILIGSIERPFFEAHRDSVQLLSPSFSQDARFLYFAREGTGELPDLMRVALGSDGFPRGDPQLVVQAFDGDYRTPYFDNISLSNGLAHSADGTIVYTRMVVESNVARFDVDGSGAAPVPNFLTTGSATYDRVRMAPDQSRVALLRITRTETTAGFMPGEGSGLRSIVTSAEPLGDVAWSPDGDRLAITWKDPGTGLRLLVYDLASETPRTVDTGEIGSNLTWVEDQLVVQGPANRSLLTIDPESGTARILVPDTVGYNFFPRASSDGRRIAYFKRLRPGASGIWMLELESDRTPRLLIAEEVRPLRFDDTGELLFVTDNGLSAGDGPDQGRLRVLQLSLETGELQTVQTLPEGFTAQDITRDGRTILATRFEWRGDVWRLVPPPD